MATHSSILASKIPWTEEPGGLVSKGSQTVGHDWATEHTHWTVDTDFKVYIVFHIKKWKECKILLQKSILKKKELR